VLDLLLLARRGELRDFSPTVYDKLIIEVGLIKSSGVKTRLC